MKRYVKITTVLFAIILLLLTGITTVSAYYYDDYYYGDYDDYYGDYEDQYDCDHNYIQQSVSDYYVTFECDICNATKSGSIPDSLYVAYVDELYDSWISYGYYSIPSEFTPGETINIYAYTYYSYEYPELEITSSDDSVVKISKVEHDYYDNIYALEFLKEGPVTITISSAYDSSVVYKTLSFTPKCDHNFVTESVNDYYIKFKCDKCQETKSGSLPSELTVAYVSEINDSWISYGYDDIPSEFSPGETINIYAYTYYSYEYPELEITSSDDSIVKISKVEHDYYDNIYTLEFLKEGPVTITISSAYDSSVVYKTLSFTPRCDHDYSVKGVIDYVVTFECSKCNETTSGNIPSYVWLYEVDEISDDGMSYSYISTSFTSGQKMTVLAETSYSEYSDIEISTLNSKVLKIEKVQNESCELYSFEFLKEGVATVIVTSKYDSSVIYEVLTFISDGYDTYLDDYLSYTSEKERSGDIDGSGKITSADARLILRISADLSKCSLPTMQYADADGDGKVTATDARIILRVSAGISREEYLAEFYKLNEDSYYNDGYGNTRTISLKVGEKCSADTYIIRDAANVTYTSSNTAVATIDKSNNIKAVKKGYACVTVTNGKETFTYEVFVLTPNDKLDKYLYGNQEISLGINDTMTIEYVILKDTKNLTWKSTNPSVATVDQNGKVKGLKKGYTCIIASNGKESCYYDINVKNELQEKIDLYREKYPDGYYWNNHTPSKTYPNVSEQPCTDHRDKKYQYCKGQCAGFADLMFREVYGSKAKKNYGVTWDTVEIGDYIRLNPHHSIFIIDVVKKGEITGYNEFTGKHTTASETYVKVVHCNWGSCCNITWDDVFYKNSYSINTSASYSAQ